MTLRGRKKRLSCEQLEARWLLTAKELVPFAYAWVDNSTSTSLSTEPNATYAYNPTGEAIQVARTGDGKYSVTFHGLHGAGTGGGNVQISAYGSTPTFCKVEHWGPAGVFGFFTDDFVAKVGCYSTNGTPTDTRFNIAVAHQASVLASQPGHRFNQGDIAFAWAGSPSDPSYEAHEAFANNPAGDVLIKRASTGSYQVNFQGLGGNQTGGTVQVTGYGTTNTYCSVASWGSSVDLLVNVRCFTPDGALVDAPFSIAVIPPVNDSSIAYAWTDRPTSGSYTPSSTYAQNPTSGAITATRQAVGKYRVHFSDLNPSQRFGGHIQVTPYGSTASVCQVASWTTFEDDLIPSVYCYDSAGAPKDTRFTIAAVGPPEGDRFEPNDTAAGATNLPSGEVHLRDLTILDCGIGVPNCSVPDFYKWTASEDTSIRIDAIFRQIDGNLDLEVSSTTGAAFGQFSNTNNESILALVLAGETVTIVVRGRTGATNSSYELKITYDDHADTPDAASRKVRDPRPESYFVGQIESNVDSDWFRFDAYAGNDLRLQSFTEAGNLTVHLYDQDRLTLLRSSSTNAPYDPGVGNPFYGPQIDWSVPRDGTYFVKVTGGSPQPYSLRISGIEPPIDPNTKVELTTISSTRGIVRSDNSIWRFADGVVEFAMQIDSSLPVSDIQATFSSPYLALATFIGPQHLQVKNQILGTWTNVATTRNANGDLTAALSSLPHINGVYHFRFTVPLTFLRPGVEPPLLCRSDITGEFESVVDSRTAVGLYVSIYATGLSSDVLSNPIIFLRDCLPGGVESEGQIHLSLFDLSFPGSRNADIVIDDVSEPIQENFSPPTSSVLVELDDPFGDIIRIGVATARDVVGSISTLVTEAASVSLDLLRLNPHFDRMFVFDAGRAARDVLGSTDLDEFTFQMGRFFDENIESIGLAFGAEDVIAPMANTAPSNVNSNQTWHPLSVTYSDAGGIDNDSIGTGDIVVIAPDATLLAATFERIVSSGDSTTTVRYRITGPGGTWDASDPQGRYVVRSVPDEVLDKFGNPVPAQEIGSFTVAIDPPTPLVNTLQGQIDPTGAILLLGTGQRVSELNLSSPSGLLRLDSADPFQADTANVNQVELSSAAPVVVDGVFGLGTRYLGRHPESDLLASARGTIGGRDFAGPFVVQFECGYGRRPGDINGDGRLTFADLLVLSSNFPKAADAVYADGDLNCDGRISFADLLSLAGEFQ